MQIPTPTRWFNIIIVLGEEAVRWIFRRFRRTESEDD
jgi:hypothetical protein